MRPCTPQAPLIQLDPSGQPALLNYNLPQSTVYEATSFVDLDLAATKYSDTAKAIPLDSYWSNFPTPVTVDALKTRLLNGDNALIVNAELLPRTPILDTPVTNDDKGGVTSRVTTNTLYASAATPTATTNTPERTVAFRFVLPSPHTEESIAQHIVNGEMPVAYVGFSGVVNIPKSIRKAPRKQLFGSWKIRIKAAC